MTFLPLLATILALMCGPLLYGLAVRRPAFLSFLDGFVLVSIAGLILLEVLPSAYEAGGIWIFAFLALGALGPSLIERTLYQARREAHLATLGLAVIGLILHSVADGAAMTPEADPHELHGHGRGALAIAIIVHSVPLGLVVWWVMAPAFGRLWPALTLLLMSLATLCGYLFGLELSQWLGEKAFACFESLVAGSVLHVVFGRPHLEEDSVHRMAPPPWEGLGSLAALVGLYALNRVDPHGAAVAPALEKFYLMMSAAAPSLLLALLAVSLLHKQLGTKRRWEHWGPPLLAASVLWPLLGWELAAIYLVAVGLLNFILQFSVFELSSPAAQIHQRPDAHSYFSALMKTVDASAPWLLFGACISLLAQQIDFPASMDAASNMALIALAAAASFAVRLHPLAAALIALAMIGNGNDLSVALALLLAAAGGRADSLKTRLLRLGYAIIFALIFSQLPSIQLTAWAPSTASFVASQSLLLLVAIMLLSLVNRGSRAWLSEVMGDHGTHAH